MSVNYGRSRVYNNTIQGNPRTAGLEVDTNNIPTYLSVISNTIRDNNGRGVIVTGGVHLTMTANLVDHNSGGVEVAYSVYGAHALIEGNRIQHNHSTGLSHCGAGIYASSGGMRMDILGNLIHGNYTGCRVASAPPTPEGIRVEALTEYTADTDCAARVREMRLQRDPAKTLAEAYQDLRVIDAHNHGAAEDTLRVLRRQKRYFIDRTVLFGAISEPAAVDSDNLAYLVYAQYPDQVYPFFAGVPIYDRAGITMTADNLEKGYFGIGEIVGASTQSPVTSHLAWKAEHPNDGNLPEIYKLSARYRAPVLLHIDPPEGEPVARLEQALDENPEAVLIFGHANAYNPPQNIERLAGRSPTLFFDFFAGFTASTPTAPTSWPISSH